MITMINQRANSDCLIKETEPVTIIRRRRHTVVGALRVVPKTLHDRKSVSRVDTIQIDSKDVGKIEHPADASVFPRQFSPSFDDDFGKNSVVSTKSLASPESACSSGRTTPTQVTQSQQSKSIGSLTERDSIGSFEDEFDRNQGLELKKVFDDIDRMMFERETPRVESVQRNKTLHIECNHWLEAFTHLRINGTSVVSGDSRFIDSGFTYIETTPKVPSNVLVDISDNDLSLSQTDELKIVGTEVQVNTVPKEKLRINDKDPPGEYSMFEEEIIVEDGHIEEVFAYDNSPDSEEVGLRTRRKSTWPKATRGFQYPPITPQECLKDNVIQNIFYILWKQCSVQVEPLLKLYLDSINSTQTVQGKEKETINILPSPSFTLQESRETSNIFNTKLSLALPEKRLYTANTCSVDDLKDLTPRSYLGINNNPTNKSGELIIGKAMLISKMSLQRREKSIHNETLEPHSSFGQSRPQSMTKRGERMGTSIKRSRGTLPPVERNKTPQVDDLISPPMQNEVIKGKALSQKQLPPIGVTEQIWDTKYTSTARAASAHHKDKSNFTLDGRPSTTHSNYANVHKRFEIGTPQGRNVTNTQGLNVQGSNFGGYHQDDTSEWGRFV
ncbi:DgyrCDS554 [Dimorphilus gyrociliatus]|uniref:DgyrCDS554 n=1 Tax=Dimorphilus gyrociliatus TaxID=2664684 RepID=A0A7I8V7H3_9ANNE|nr:DgyrCDS554 [Dimorphilus gyrociliatus]